MLRLIARWIEDRKRMRRRWKSDARMLIMQNERGAYYAAQRLAARARATGDAKAFLHWAKVAAEVTRLSPVAETDMLKVTQIVEEELTAPR